jgi:hypothetical protein
VFLPRTPLRTFSILVFEVGDDVSIYRNYLLILCPTCLCKSDGECGFEKNFDKTQTVFCLFTSSLLFFLSCSEFPNIILCKHHISYYSISLSLFNLQLSLQFYARRHNGERSLSETRVTKSKKTTIEGGKGAANRVWWEFTIIIGCKF